ncbi:MAG: DUF2163 domain-containing protein [Magnetococcales bacterium]|nr:DUF2163 domain-containing protein [Magnetococcales bacterium]
MREASQELTEYLLSEHAFIMADLFDIELTNGTVLRYCSFDADITFNGQLYSASGPIIRRSRTRCVIGVEVDTLNLEVAPSPMDTLLGLPWIHAAGIGVLDGATVVLYRVFLRNDLAVVGGVILFVGQVADLQTSRHLVKLTVNSHAQMLNVKMPRNLWQPGCLHTLYDADCGAARNGSVASVGAGSTSTMLYCALSLASGWFDQGYVQFSSGALAGVRRTVKSYTPGVFQLLLPLPSIPAVGDGFTAYPGCDKTQATCAAKFNNLINFRGFPYIPVSETAA